VKVLLWRTGIGKARIVKSGKVEVLWVDLEGPGSWARDVRWDAEDPDGRGKFGYVDFCSARCHVWILAV
jgi:hypothetical protein